MSLDDNLQRLILDSPNPDYVRFDENPVLGTATGLVATPVSGQLEYTGGGFYISIGANQRGLVPARVLSRADAAFTLTNGTSAQALLAAAQDALTVVAGASYRFKCVARLTTGATSSSVSFSLGGTATFTTINYVSFGIDAASGTAAAPVMNNGEVATDIVVCAAGTGVNKRFLVEGEFEVNAAGTIIPQIKFSADPTGALTTNVGSFFEAWQTGANPVTTVGPWA